MSLAPAHATAAPASLYKSPETVRPSAPVCKQRSLLRWTIIKFAENVALRVLSGLGLVPWVGSEGALGPGWGWAGGDSYGVPPPQRGRCSSRDGWLRDSSAPSGNVPPRLTGGSGTTPSCPISQSCLGLAPNLPPACHLIQAVPEPSRASVSPSEQHSRAKGGHRQLLPHEAVADTGRRPLC